MRQFGDDRAGLGLMPIGGMPLEHAVEGRDREVAKALSDMLENGSAAQLPRTIKVRPS